MTIHIDAHVGRPGSAGLARVKRGVARQRVVSARPRILGKRRFFGYTVSPIGEIWLFANPPSERAPPSRRSSRPLALLYLLSVRRYGGCWSPWPGARSRCVCGVGG